MSMFENYENISKAKPNNRHIFCQIDKIDEIIPGGNAEHTFIAHFKLSEYCDSNRPFEIIYKQGLQVIETLTYPVILGQNRYNIIVEEPENADITIIRVMLKPLFTSKFIWNRETAAQIKLFMLDGSVIYGDINQVKIIKALDAIND